MKILKNKSEAEENLVDYVNFVKSQKKVNVKAFRLDNGGEFSSNRFKQFCKNYGRRLEYTMPYSPQSNGKAERINRTLLNKVRTKIIESGLPKFLWDEARKCSVYKLNRLPNSFAWKIHKLQLVYGMVGRTFQNFQFLVVKFGSRSYQNQTS